MSAGRAYWREVHDRFDPQAPPAREAWVVDRPDSPILEIADKLRLPFGTGQFLIGSTPGTGTTTELQRLRRLVEHESHLVVALDLQRHFSETVRDLSALQEITPQEVLLLVGLAVVEATHRRLGRALAPERVAALEQAWRRVLDDAAPGVEIDVGKLAPTLARSLMGIGASALDGGVSQALTVGAAVAGGVSSGIRWPFRFGGGHLARSDQDSVSQDLYAAVAEIIGDVQQLYDKRVILLLDGLDRIETAAVTRGLFVRSRLIGQLPCSVVASAPISLRHGLDTTLVAPFVYRVLPNVPVLSRAAPADPHQPGTGLQTLEQLYRVRTADLAGDFGLLDAHVRHLAWCSGGHVREFVTLMREVASRAWLDDVPRSRDDDVAAAIDQLRLDKERGLRQSHVRVLAQVLADPTAPLPDDEAVDDMLRTRRLLPYANGSEWFFPHPTLASKLASVPSGR